MKDTILFITHSTEHCGVYQYGVNIHKSLSKLSEFNVCFKECNTTEEFLSHVAESKPIAAIFNYHPSTMPWLNKNLDYINRFLNFQRITTLGMFHEVTQGRADKLHQNIFPYNICPDPTLIPTNERTLVIPRLIIPLEEKTKITKPEKFTVSSFGFPFKNKNFGVLLKQVNEEFDEAVIKLNLPYNQAVDPTGSIDSNKVMNMIKGFPLKEGIELKITHDFLEPQDILKFLGESHLNCFLYERAVDRGCSSCLDYAFSVKVPVALSDSEMFRHVTSVKPELILGNSSLKEIVNNGVEPLEDFYNKWSEDSFVKSFDEVLKGVLYE